VRPFEPWNMSLLVIRLAICQIELAVIQRPLKLTMTAQGRPEHARRAHIADALRAKMLAGIAASLGTGLVLELAEVRM
jgi:hypothetical protein